jgi:hypothetical protein
MGKKFQKVNIQKKKHELLQIHMYNMFVIVEPIYETWRRKKRKRE